MSRPPWFASSTGYSTSNARGRIVRVGQVKRALVELKDLATIAEEVDAEVTLVEVTLDAEPTVESSFALSELVAAALVANIFPGVLPVSAEFARVGGGEFLINRDVGGNLPQRWRRRHR